MTLSEILIGQKVWNSSYDMFIIITALMTVRYRFHRNGLTCGGCAT